MPDSPFHELQIIGTPLEADMEQVLRGRLDARAAGYDFALQCNGPSFSKSARTVWRVDGAGVPAPYVSVFNWGGHFFGIPHLRIWFVERSGYQPQGVGAFPDTDGPGYPEEHQISARLRNLLKAPGCYLIME